jgi:mono/diheme cytochrome c family protein
MQNIWRTGLWIAAVCLLIAGCTNNDNHGGETAAVDGDPYVGGLVWNNWTDAVAGGSGYPEGFDAGKKDFLRCKACHGWDGQGLNGGYVRRSAKDSRPKPMPSADLSEWFGTITAKDVWYADGRDFAVLNNAMPAFDRAGGLSDRQVADVVAFLNKGPKIGEFAEMDISQKPVVYTFAGADPNAGGEAYTARCASCHAADGEGLDMSLGDYFRQDGKYSEGFHKMVYGAGGNSIMTRKASGDLSGEQAADILAFIQAHLGTTF